MIYISKKSIGIIHSSLLLNTQHVANPTGNISTNRVINICNSSAGCDEMAPRQNNALKIVWELQRICEMAESPSGRTMAN